MESWLIVTLVTLGYLLVSLMVGVMSGRRASSSTVGYVAADREFGFLVMYFVMGASIFSAFAFLGGPGWAYSRGAAAFYILAYGVVGLAPWYFFGPRAAELGRRYGYVTQAELFAHRFESPALSMLMAVISLICFLPYLVLQMEGAGFVFNVVTEGRISEAQGAAIAYGVVLVYVYYSGVMGVGWTNTFQGIFMMALAWGLGIYLPYQLYGGVGPMFEAIAEAAPTMLTAPGLDADGSVWTWGGFSSSIAISVFGFSLWPHYFMKIYTAKDVRTLKKTVVWYPTFMIFLVPIMFIGFSGVLRYPDVTPADAILPTIITSLDLPAVVVGLFCAGALAASMSTGDALVHAAGSILVNDLYKVGFKPDIDDVTERRLIRVLVVVIAGIAYYFAVFSDFSLVWLLLFSYGFLDQFLPLILAAFFWPRATRPGVVAGLLVGCAVVVIWTYFPQLQWQRIHPGLWGLVANLVTMVAVSLATAPMEREHVEKFVVV